MRAKWSIYLLLFFNATLMGLIVISDFYSLFTDEFYVLKKENYLTLLVALPYWLYLVVVGLKIQQEENTDPAMRNLEFLVYFALAGGLWQVWTVYRDWSQYAELQQHYILPESFYPMPSNNARKVSAHASRCVFCWSRCCNLSSNMAD